MPSAEARLVFPIGPPWSTIRAAFAVPQSIQALIPSAWRAFRVASSSAFHPDRSTAAGLPV